MGAVTFTERAAADLDRLHAFLATESPRSARRAIVRIVEGIDLLLLFPQSGVLIRGDVRQLIIRFGRGAYVVRYSIVGDDILIARIWHSRERRKK